MVFDVEIDVVAVATDGIILGIDFETERNEGNTVINFLCKKTQKI